MEPRYCDLVGANETGISARSHMVRYFLLRFSLLEFSQGYSSPRDHSQALSEVRLAHSSKSAPMEKYTIPLEKAVELSPVPSEPVRLFLGLVIFFSLLFTWSSVSIK